MKYSKALPSYLIAALLSSCEAVTAGTFFCEFDSRPGLNVGAQQGVCTDGTNFWTTAGDDPDTDPASNNHNMMLRRYDSSWTIVASNDVIADLPGDATQINGLEYKDGVVYVGVNDHVSGSQNGNGGWIMEYDPVTLTNLATHTVQTKECEGGAWGGAAGTNFLAVYHNSRTVSVYNSSFTFISDHFLDYPNDVGRYYQDAAWHDGHLFCPVHNSAQWPHTVDVYKWEGETNFVRAGRMLQPTWERSATLRKSSQGLDFDPVESGVIWFAERNAGGGESEGPHNVVKATFNATAHPDNEVFSNAVQNLDNLLFYLPLRETTGTNLVDNSGAGNDFTLRVSDTYDLDVCGDILGPTYCEKGRGVALSEKAYLHHPNEAEFNFTSSDSFSFGMFVFRQHAIDNNEWILSKGIGGDSPSGNNHNYALLIDLTTPVNRFDFLMEESDGTDHVCKSNTTVEEGKAYFVVCVYDGSSTNMSIYVNGVLDGTNNDQFTVNTNVYDLTFNAASNGDNGGIDQTAVGLFEPFMTSDVLTGAEISALWAKSKSTKDFVQRSIAY